MKTLRNKKVALLSLLSLPAVLLVALGGPAAAAPHARAASTVRSSSLGPFRPTFVGSAATGCASGCQLMTGPFRVPSVAHLSSKSIGRRASSPDRFRALPSLPLHSRAAGHATGPRVQIPTVS